MAFSREVLVFGYWGEDTESGVAARGGGGGGAGGEEGRGYI